MYTLPRWVSCRHCTTTLEIKDLVYNPVYQTFTPCDNFRLRQDFFMFSASTRGVSSRKRERNWYISISLPTLWTSLLLTLFTTQWGLRSNLSFFVVITGDSSLGVLFQFTFETISSVLSRYLQILLFPYLLVNQTKTFQRKFSLRPGHRLYSLHSADTESGH